MAKSKKTQKKKAPAKKSAPAKKMTKPKVVAKSAKASGATKKPTSKNASAPVKKTAGRGLATVVTNLSPLRSRVLIKREEGETKTPGGLIIPDVAKDKPLSGRVVATGTGTFNKKGHKRPLDVQVGDRVLFSRYSGSQIQLNGEDLLVVEEAEILGIIQD